MTILNTFWTVCEKTFDDIHDNPSNNWKALRGEYFWNEIFILNKIIVLSFESFCSSQRIHLLFHSLRILQYSLDLILLIPEEIQVPNVPITSIDKSYSCWAPTTWSIYSPFSLPSSSSSSSSRYWHHFSRILKMTHMCHKYICVQY
jgi:hypothetical protein